MMAHKMIYLGKSFSFGPLYGTSGVRGLLQWINVCYCSSVLLCLFLFGNVLPAKQRSGLVQSEGKNLKEEK